MRFNYKKFYYFFLLFFLMPFSVVFAGEGPGPPASSFENPIKFDSLREFLTAIINVIIAIAFPLIVLAIIYTGFLFVSSRGDETKLKTAKASLVWTVIGAMIILGAFVLSNAISKTVKEIESAQINTPHLVIYHRDSST